MISRAERIAQHLADGLRAPAMTTVPPARVHRDLHGALDEERLPAIAVETGDEPVPSNAQIGAEDRWVRVHLAVVGAGANPYGAADAALLEAHARVMADCELGGLAIDIREAETRRRRHEGVRQLGVIEKTYVVQYRTAEGELV